MATTAAEATRVEAPALAAAQAVAPLKAEHEVPVVGTGAKLAQAAAVEVAADAQVTLTAALAAVPAGMQTRRVEAVATVAAFSHLAQHPEDAQSVDTVQIAAAALDIIS